MRRRSFLATIANVVATVVGMPAISKLFASEPKPMDKVRVISHGEHPAMKRLKQSVEFHRHMPALPVNNSGDARDFYLKLMRREAAAPWSGSEITYGNGSSDPSQWAHTFGQGEPATDTEATTQAAIQCNPGEFPVATAESVQKVLKGKRLT